MSQQLKNLLRILRDTFLCRWQQFFNQLQYPPSILPHLSYKATIDIDPLLDSAQIYLLRRSAKPQDETFHEFPEMYVLREDAIGYKELTGLSVNLMGADFKENYLKFRVPHKSAGGIKWDGKSRVFLSEHLSDIEEVESFSTIFLDANKLHRNEVPYVRDKNLHLKKEISDFYNSMIPSAVEENSKYNLSATTIVEHDPIILNYWHVEFKIINYNDTPLDAAKGKTWIEDLSKQVIKDIITINSFPTAPAIETIKNTHYIKSA